MGIRKCKTCRVRFQRYKKGVCAMSNNKKIMVAMSGGVDSSVSAFLLKQQGFDVVGATLKTWDSKDCVSTSKNICCSLNDINDARKCADVLGIRHYVLDAVDIFKREVIDDFFKQYSNGRTPNPCVLCNEKIKFGFLLEKARAIGCDFLATGHYARICEKDGIFHLLEGKDENKDQSYALFGLSQRVMKNIILPLGDYSKSKIREIAKDSKLPVYEKKDSQELCFIRELSTEDYIKKNMPSSIRPGNIVDVNNKVLGRHDGICFYTIGQRNKIGAYGKPMYVVGIYPDKNVIQIGTEEYLLKKDLKASCVNWVNPLYRDMKNFSGLVKIRYKNKKVSCQVNVIDDKNINIVFDVPVKAITPGQAAVVYMGDEVVCGGWID